MPSLSRISLFLPAALAVLVIPGPAVSYIVARSVHQGRRAGIVSVLGLTTGLLIQVTAAVAGLSALVLSSAVGFRAVKLAGAGYLVFLGVRTLLRRETPGDLPRARARSTRRLFVEGMVINTLNPKPALFLAAFLPQFVDPSRGPASLQLLVLGLMFCGLALVSDGAYAVLAGTVAERVRRRRASRAARRHDAARYAAAGTYVGLGMLAAFSGERRS